MMNTGDTKSYIRNRGIPKGQNEQKTGTHRSRPKPPSRHKTDRDIRHTDRATHRETEADTERQTDIQTDRQTDNCGSLVLLLFTNSFARTANNKE